MKIRRIDFWKLFIAKDDYLLSFIQRVADMRNLWGIADRRALKAGHRLMLDRSVKNGEAVIVLNGPCVKKQHIERIYGKDIFFVNQGFRLPCYREVHPKYHIFVDTKLIHGVWDVHWLEEILEMVPDITFAMPASWARTHLFDSYIERKVPIIWLPGKIAGVRGAGVSGAAFYLAQRLGYNRLYFTGFEATSFASILLSQASHFYGNDSDEATLTASDIMKGYYLNARHIRELIIISSRMKKKGVELYNLTEGGILQMFERKNFDDVFPMVPKKRIDAEICPK